MEMMGIELPDPSKPKSKFNNRKMTFDKICRDLLFEICENHDLYMQREVTSGGGSISKNSSISFRPELKNWQKRRLPWKRLR